MSDDDRDNLEHTLRAAFGTIRVEKYPDEIDVSVTGWAVEDPHHPEVSIEIESSAGCASASFYADEARDLANRILEAADHAEGNRSLPVGGRQMTPSGDDRTRLAGDLGVPVLFAEVVAVEGGTYQITSVPDPAEREDVDVSLQFGDVNVSVSFTRDEARRFADHLVTAAEDTGDASRREADR